METELFLSPDPRNKSIYYDTKLHIYLSKTIIGLYIDESEYYCQIAVLLQRYGTTRK